ncbi:MAG TPA: DUF1015 domain-containing protein [Sumerlaeia bacterium]|nr:DUF1015 domain-containing protein [Sumerlaeia bacterium]
MARVLPFVGTRYNPKAIEDLSAVMAPPYDVITPEMQKEMYERSPHNIVRLILGKEQVDDDEYNNKYQRAGSYLREWKGNGTLIDDPCKNFYVYQQEFRTPDKKMHVRTGFFAAVLLEDPDKGMVRAHEHTFEGPKADRLKLLRSTHCNLSPIFCLYSDPGKETDALLASVTAEEPPRTELTDSDRATHRLWLMPNAAKVKKLSSMLQDTEFLIADGHHRYETALQYCREMRSKGEGEKAEAASYAYAMTFLTNCESEGLVILPTHRVLSRELGEGVEHDEVVEDLSQFFDLQPRQVDLKKTASEGVRLCAEIEDLGRRTNAFALVLPGGRGYLLSLKPNVDPASEMREDVPAAIAKLDVSILHEYILAKVWVGNPEIELDDRDIEYVKDPGAALKMLGPPTFASGVFLMNQPSMEEVREITSQNLRMPHKTTYFYPKLLSGMVLRDLSAPW